MATSNGVGGSDLLGEVMQRLRGTRARTRSYSVACDNVKHTLSHVPAVHFVRQSSAQERVASGFNIPKW